VQHFAHEERLFKQWKYPDVDDLSADPNAAVLLLQITQLGHAMHLEVVPRASLPAAMAFDSCHGSTLEAR
jgi:hypothetical protein